MIRKGLISIPTTKRLDRLGESLIVASDEPIVPEDGREVQDSWCREFDSVNQYVTTTATPLASGSIEGYFKTDDASVSAQFMAGSYSSTNNSRCYLSVSGIGVAKRLTAGIGTDSLTVIKGTTQILADVWYHAKLTWDGTTVSLHLDGNLEFSGDQHGTTNDSSVFTIGCNNTNGTPNSSTYFSGKLVDVKATGVFHYNLQESSGTVAIDASGNGNHGIYVNGPVAVADPTMPPAADKNNLEGYNLRTSFNSGSSTAVVLGNVHNDVFAGADKKFTWKSKVVIGGGATETIIAKYGDTSVGVQQRQFVIRSGSGKIEVLYYGALPPDAYRATRTTDVVLTTGMQHDIEVRYDGSVDTNEGLDRVTILVDGVVKNQILWLTHGVLGDIQVGTADLAFGSAYANSQFVANRLNGVVSDIKLYDDATGTNLVGQWDGHGIDDWTDNVGSADGTVIGASDIIIPAASETLDAYGNDLEFVGSVYPRHPVRTDSFALALSGTAYLNSTVKGADAGELSCWFKSTADNGCIMGSQLGINRCYLQCRSGKLGGGLGSKSYTDMLGTSIINDGEWHYVSMTWDGVDVNLVVDGVTEVTLAQAGVVEKTLDISIGALNTGTVATHLACEVAGAIIIATPITCSEGVGTLVHSTDGSTVGTLVNATTGTEGAGVWSGRQDEVHSSLDLGFSFCYLEAIFTYPLGIGATTDLSFRVQSDSTFSTVIDGDGLSQFVSDLNSTTSNLSFCDAVTVDGTYYTVFTFGDLYTILSDGAAHEITLHECDTSVPLKFGNPGLGMNLNGISDVRVDGVAIYEPTAIIERKRIPAQLADPTLDILGGTLTNPAVEGRHNDAETLWDMHTITNNNTASAASYGLDEFPALAFADLDDSLKTTTDANQAFARNVTPIRADRLLGYQEPLTDAGDISKASTYTADIIIPILFTATLFVPLF